MTAMAPRSLLLVGVLSGALAAAPAAGQSPIDRKVVPIVMATATPTPAPTAAASSTPAPPVALTLTLAPIAPEIGAVAYLELPPQQGEPFDALTIKSTLAEPALRLMPPEATAPGRFRIPVRFLRGGEIVVPALTLEATRSDAEPRLVATAPLTVTVTELDANKAVAETDYTDLVQAAPTLWRYYVAGAVAFVVALVLLALGAMLLRRMLRARAMAAVAQPALAPIDEAQRALRELTSLDIYRTAGSKAHYFELSMLLRRYLERQWRVSAMEWTEDEVMERLTRPSSHTSAPAPELLSVFENGSMAKYAKHEVEETLVRADLDAARAFLAREEKRLAAAAALRSAAPNTAKPREAA